MKNLIAVLLALTLICSLIYLTAQQVLRQSANDPQIQFAEDAAASLADGKVPDGLPGLAGTSTKVDLAKSLAPFLISFDENLQPQSSSAELNGQTPIPPRGVFEYARIHGENRLTWQPRPGVRAATILVHYSGQKSGFVLAGRSLREIETRVPAIGHLVMAGWLASVVVLATTALGLLFFGGFRRGA